MAYGSTLYYIWLSEKFPKGSDMQGRLLRAFGTAENVYGASTEELLERGFTKTEIRALEGKGLARAEDIANDCFNKGVSVISYGDGMYPDSLRYTDAPPAVLYARGILPSFEDNLFITAVGTRNMTPQGKRAAHKLCFDMAAAGAVIVSGMARGIDSFCHRGAIDGGGITIAVLGSGCDIAYPPENELLMNEILRSGAVISEYPPSEEPKQENFPVRNRLMAALSAATVVVEAGVGSGALITARYAEEYGRELYAVPGSAASAASKGVNELIKQGVKVATEASDVLGVYELSFAHRISLEKAKGRRYFMGSYQTDEAEDMTDINSGARPFSVPGISRAAELEGESRKIYELLMKNGAMSPEELAESGVVSSAAVYRLTLLEIGGYVTVLPGGKYAVK